MQEALNKMKKYTVITFNIGGYEVLREIEHKSPDAEYIYVTDDRSITSRTWDVRYIDNPYPEDNFYTCFHIRYNPFDYASTDVVLKIDGSLQILDNIDDIIDYFNKGAYDICLEVHPERYTIAQEYDVWCKKRGYSREQADKVLSYMAIQGYDTSSYRGLYQYCFMIQRRNPVNMELNAATLALAQEFAPEGKKIDRLDQTIGSYVINTRFSDRLKVMVVDERILHSRFFRWYRHGTWQEAPFNGVLLRPYLFNKPVKAARLNYCARAFIYKWWLPRPVVLVLNVVKRFKDMLLRKLNK